VTSATIGCAGRKYVWLKDHGYIDKLEDYVEAKDKYLINYDYIIDDNYANIEHSNKRNLLFSAPWNLKYNYPRRINSWKEFIEERKEWQKN
jgi:5'(3')-deoxyribonucleotidase